MGLYEWGITENNRRARYYSLTKPAVRSCGGTKNGCGMQASDGL